jgi:beta-glucosidase
MTDLRSILARMDLDQKIGQIQGIVPMDMLAVDSTAGHPTGDVAYDVDRVAEVRPHGVGHLSLGGQLTPDINKLRSELIRFQDAARQVAPFGIGVLVHAEGIGGLVHPQGHQFTTAWGQAASWNPDVPRTVGDVAARQSREVGIHLLFSPLLDLARDIRWGRVHETYGEDAELVAQMGMGFIRGVQGDDGRSGVLASAKHFLAYGVSLAALNQATTQLGRRELVDVHAEPFRRAIAEAGLSIVMNSYNDVDGIPAASNSWLFRELLRGQLGFDGLVVSDYGAISMLLTTFLTAASPGHAAGQALTAGIDVELPSASMTAGLRPLIEDGTFSEEVVDRAVLNVLTVKHRLGLIPAMSPPSAPHALRPVKDSEAARFAQQVAAQSVTLLANDGVLPLSPGGQRIAVVGPAAAELRIHFGAYTSVSDGEMPVAVAEILAGNVPGIEASPDVLPDMFQTRLPGVEPLFEEGARRLHPEALTVLEALRNADQTIEFHDFGSLTSDHSFAVGDLVAAVGEADVVIAVVGERTGWFGNHTAGEGRTVARPELPGDQAELVAALGAAGKRVITVVVSGRPLILDRVHEASAAVVLAPLLGPVAGETIADVLIGRIHPSGRTPSTFPRSAGQIPMYHGHPIGSGYEHPTLPRYGYTDLPDSTPLYPFGHGLSFTTFEMSLQNAGLTGDHLTVDATIRNTGTRAGTAVPQLYARDEAASVVRPVRQLLDFTRIELEPGATATVRLSAPLCRLAYTWEDGRRGVDAGLVTLMLGSSSATIEAASTVEVPEVVIEGP